MVKYSFLQRPQIFIKKQAPVEFIGSHTFSVWFKATKVSLLMFLMSKGWYENW